MYVYYRLYSVDANTDMFDGWFISLFARGMNGMDLKLKFDVNGTVHREIFL